MNFWPLSLPFLPLEEPAKAVRTLETAERRIAFQNFKHSRDLVLMANDTTHRILKKLAWEQSGFSVTATQERRWDSSEF